jgi:hypothetical protein
MNWLSASLVDFYSIIARQAGLVAWEDSGELAERFVRVESERPPARAD